MNPIAISKSIDSHRWLSSGGLRTCPAPPDCDPPCATRRRTPATSWRRSGPAGTARAAGQRLRRRTASADFVSESRASPTRARRRRAGRAQAGQPAERRCLRRAGGSRSSSTGRETGRCRPAAPGPAPGARQSMPREPRRRRDAEQARRRRARSATAPM